MRRVVGLFVVLVLFGGAAAFAAGPGARPERPPVPPPVDTEPDPDAPKVPPVYYPTNPFPPAAPAFVDPRSGAWEQRRGFPDGKVAYPSEGGPAIGAGRPRGSFVRLCERIGASCFGR